MATIFSSSSVVVEVLRRYELNFTSCFHVSNTHLQSQLQLLRFQNVFKTFSKRFTCVFEEDGLKTIYAMTLFQSRFPNLSAVF